MASIAEVDFRSKLRSGLLGEGRIAKWFIGKGYNVLPAYEVEIDSGKGPRLYSVDGPLVSPDMLVFKTQKMFWVEAKTKSAFTWHRMSGTWQDGINIRHWNEYLRVARITGFDVWILFLHLGGARAKDTPVGMDPPSGLFGNEIKTLEREIDHEANSRGTAMVYWQLCALKKLASVDELPLDPPEREQ